MLLVFGSLNVDMLFRVGALPRPGETVLCPGYQLAPGGKGANQAAAAAKAGAAVRMIGHVGDDEFGRLMRAVLQAAGVNVADVATSAEPTGTAVIGIDSRGENQIIVASGANLNTRAGQVGAGDLQAGITLLCQNEVRPAETFALIGRARAAGARSILNLAPAGPVPAPVLDALDVLVVNEHEAAVVAGVGGYAAPADLARSLARDRSLTGVITLGGLGAIAVGPDLAVRVPALPIEPVDTTGAGDAFAGVFAAALDQGRTMTAARGGPASRPASRAPRSAPRPASPARRRSRPASGTLPSPRRWPERFSRFRPAV